MDRIRLILLDEPVQVNTDSDCYYESIISFNDHEIYVDGGGYDGQSAIAFLKKIETSGKKDPYVYAFEPHSVNFKKMNGLLSHYANVRLVERGLWSIDTELTFFENKGSSSGSSFVLGLGKPITIPVTSLDNFFKGKSDQDLPTFIKMDIEGAEKEALIGSTGIIQRVKPKLAICVYHKTEDVYELPQTILNIRNDYKFILRQHAAGCYDTVMYGV